MLFTVTTGEPWPNDGIWPMRKSASPRPVAWPVNVKVPTEPVLSVPS